MFVRLSKAARVKTKKATKILSVCVVAAIILVATVIVLYHPAPATGPLPSGETPQGQFKVTSDVIQRMTWTLEQLTQMSLTNVTTVINGENATYVGVPFYDFCNRAGIPWDVGPIEVLSANGSQATINIFQVYNSSVYPYYYNNNVITLAFAKNDQWLTNQTGGPVKLVAPYFADEYQVENVAEIRFKPWAVSVTGDVANPLVIEKGNLSIIQSRTVYAEFAASEKRWSNWTGLPILDILEAANASDKAEKLTMVAVDGKEMNFTLEQVEEGQMLLGYAENGNPLSHSQGGPYRLFATTDKYKWAQYWLKFVCEIRVL